MFKNFYALVTFATILLLFSCEEHTPPFDGTYTDSIRLNQIGYYPEAVKKGVVVGTTKYSDFQVMDESNSTVVLEGKLSEPQNWKLAGEIVRIADFSDLKEPGTYHLCVKDIGYSFPFEVNTHVLAPAFLGSVKGLYYQRASMALEEKFAGKWHRAMGHPDDSVLFHPSSGKDKGFMASPKGWYDAGDYGKYVLNGSFPLGQLFTLYEEYPEAILDGDLNIPESGNGQSDYIDELKYELDWLLSMQDDDDGLFFKLTTKGFEGMIMPEDAIKQRYIIGKSTGATLDFAAAAAQAYRVYLPFDPDYASRCLEAAKKAYAWAEKNPGLQFLNPEDISTGQYGDTDFSAELFWATAELLVSTKEPYYLELLKKNAS